MARRLLGDEWASVIGASRDQQERKMFKLMKAGKIWCIGLGLAGLMSLMPAIAHAAFVLTPNGDCAIDSNPSEPKDNVFLEEKCGVTGLSLHYKSNVGGIAEGPFKNSYSTAYANSPSDPSEAIITWVGPNFITCPNCWLVVKDGNQLPQFYGFNLGSWNGKETLQLQGFWPSQGAISHVSIWSKTVEVPVPATLPLLGLGLAALGLSRRKRNRYI